MKKIAVSLLALVSLSACGIFADQGIGFTGLDGEPSSVSATRGSADYVTRRSSVPSALAGLAPVRVSADSADAADQAKAAINSGGRTPANAVEVGGYNRTLMLSTVDVNNTLYAVLRTPEGASFRMEPGTGASFASSIPRLTGCLAAGPAYGNGSSRSSGYAVPLNCR